MDQRRRDYSKMQMQETEALMARSAGACPSIVDELTADVELHLSLHCNRRAVMC